MRIIAKSTLKDFWEISGNEDAEEPLIDWYELVSKGEWQTPNEFRQTFGSCDIVGDKRIVFDIRGNKYRLIVAMDYEKQIAFIKFVGTHKEYDKIDAKTVSIRPKKKTEKP